MKRRAMYWTILIAAVVLLPVVFLAALSLIASRPANLGVHDGRLAPCPATPNCVSTQAEDAQHRMEPIPLEGTPQEAIERIQSAVAAMPRMKLITQHDNYLHFEATSLLFRFVDDVEFYVDDDAHLIHFRSASRVGHSDLGANRAGMEQIREKLRAQ
jgi:uncharacterized protein (DUF1499 family)